jgi:hypothetical protein
VHQTIKQYPLTSLFLSNIASVLCAWFLFVGTIDSNKADLLETAFEQIERQSKEIVQLRELLVESQVKLISLEQQLRIGGTKSEIIGQYLDSMPFPAWIKVYEEDKKAFVMYYINDALTIEFGIRKVDYIGKTDYELYPTELANMYSLSDHKVFESGTYTKTTEVGIIADGSRQAYTTYKFPVRINGDRKAIGGIAILQVQK